MILKASARLVLVTQQNFSPVALRPSIYIGPCEAVTPQLFCILYVIAIDFISIYILHTIIRLGFMYIRGFRCSSIKKYCVYI